MIMEYKESKNLTQEIIRNLVETNQLKFNKLQKGYNSNSIETKSE